MKSSSHRIDTSTLSSILVSPFPPSFLDTYSLSRCVRQWPRRPGFNPKSSHTKKLKKWYLMLPCLTLNIIRKGSTVKWSNSGEVVAPSPTPLCSSYRKGSLRVTLDYVRQLFLYHLWDIKPYASSLAFLFSCSFILPPVCFKNGPEYLTREIVQVLIHLMKFLLQGLVSSSFPIHLRYSFLFCFLLSPLVWWCPFPIFPNTCEFPFLWTF